MRSGRGEGNRDRREGSMEEGNGEVCTSKTLAALESSIFLTLKRVRVRMTVALPSSLLESRLPRLFSDSMPHISFSLLASSFWPEIPAKSVFIGRQGVNCNCQTLSGNCLRCEYFSQSNGQGMWWDWRCSASM